MKYYLVYNDIITFNPDTYEATTTDEPLWLRNEIDKWKDKYGCGGRVLTTPNNLQSFIISPDDDLRSKCTDDSLFELFPRDAQEIINELMPPEFDEAGLLIVQPTPTLEQLSKVFWGYAQNHSGTISTSETWTVANSPHHITGTITVAANQTLTFDPGITVYHDGDYRITLSSGTGGLYAVGNSSGVINVLANAELLGTATRSTLGGLLTANTGIGNGCFVNLQFARFQNFSSLMSIGATTGNTFTLNNLHVTGCGALINFAAGYNKDITVSNCLFQSSSASWSYSSTSTGSLTFSHCDFYGVGSYSNGSSGMQTQINFIDCYSPNQIGSNLKVSMLRSFLLATVGMGSANTYNTSFESCIYKNCGFSLGNTSGGAHTFLNCDFVRRDSVAMFNQTTPTPIQLQVTSCFIAGTNSTGFSNYFTGVQSTLQVTTNDAAHFAFITPRTTRNFVFTPASISSGSITNTGATIAWTVDFKTRNRVRYGTSSGVYTSTEDPYQTWSGWDGSKMQSVSASIPLSNLTPGITYFYVAESYDLVTDTWVTSAEGSFQTTGSGGGGSTVIVIED
jgi:hypothetical protein